MIGVDPHKGSHTAVAIGRDEAQLGKVRVRSSRHQLDQLLEWAAPFEQRTWAIESAGGLGYLLAQQLVAAGETVLDVPATLAARVRVLGTGRSNKNDPNDALSVAVAALRAPRLASVARTDHAGVLRLLAKRNTDLGRARNKTACRLHALLAELVPGGIPNEINAASAQRMLAGVKPQSPVEVARHALALEHLDDLRRLDAQMRVSKRRIADAVYRLLLIDARTLTGPGGQPGTPLQSSVAGPTPRRPALRISHSRARTNARARRAAAGTTKSSRAPTPTRSV